MGIVPIWGFQMLAALFLSYIFRLNKIIVLLFSNISIPPLIPFHFGTESAVWRWRVRSVDHDVRATLLR